MKKATVLPGNITSCQASPTRRDRPFMVFHPSLAVIKIYWPAERYLFFQPDLFFSLADEHLK
jgi:hypothetical protein